MGDAALVAEGVWQGEGCGGEVCGEASRLAGWDQGAAVRPLLAPALVASCPQATQVEGQAGLLGAWAGAAKPAAAHHLACLSRCQPAQGSET
ncbi:hypothetical protein HaLaN_30920 [Haematococcus lacustris]|uniref:Uncharacterized protein n=1 Tax=Haematococcus lacustris TaxID=44745 RepID=A0A6A0AIZ5_HAELA|nr:hypothetical protein HaLaN_30920 [Haematococcus lacustris]